MFKNASRALAVLVGMALLLFQAYRVSGGKIPSRTKPKTWATGDTMTAANLNINPDTLFNWLNAYLVSVDSGATDDQTTAEITTMLEDSTIDWGGAVWALQKGTVDTFELGTTASGDYDQIIYFATDGSQTGESLKWDDGNSQFEMSNDLLVGGKLDVNTDTINTSGAFGARLDGVYTYPTSNFSCLDIGGANGFAVEPSSDAFLYSAYGIWNYIVHGGTNGWGDIRGIYNKARHTSTDSLTNLVSMFSEVTSGGGSGKIEEAVGYWSEVNLGGSGAVTGYHLYLDTMAGCTNKYGIYSPGADEIHYFNGSVGIGTDSPSYKFEVDGGDIGLGDGTVGDYDATIYFADDGGSETFKWDDGDSNFVLSDRLYIARTYESTPRAAIEIDWHTFDTGSTTRAAFKSNAYCDTSTGHNVHALQGQVYQYAPAHQAAGVVGFAYADSQAGSSSSILGGDFHAIRESGVDSCLMRGLEIGVHPRSPGWRLDDETRNTGIFLHNFQNWGSEANYQAGVALFISGTTAASGPGWNSAILLQTQNLDCFRVSGEGEVGIKTHSDDVDLEVNADAGGTMRLTYDDRDGSAATYADFKISSAGKVEISPTGKTVSFGDTTSGDTDVILGFATDGDWVGEEIRWDDGDGRFEVSDDAWFSGQIEVGYQDSQDSLGVDFFSPSHATIPRFQVFAPEAQGDRLIFLGANDGVYCMDDGSNSFFGIGTTSPAYALHIDGGHIALGDTATGDHDAIIYFGDDASPTAESFMWNDGNERFQLTDDFYIGGGLKVTGNVGIGTDTPFDKLHVNGGNIALGDVSVGDHDATLFFADDGNWESIKWDDGDDRFEVSDTLYVAQDLEVAGISNIRLTSSVPTVTGTGAIWVDNDTLRVVDSGGDTLAIAFDRKY